MMPAVSINNRRSLTMGNSLVADLRAEDSVDAKTFAELRRRVMLDGCKWDAQVGDITALAPFPLVMKRDRWNELASHAERLAAEAAAAELEIVLRPELLRLLGLPPALLKTMMAHETLTPAAGRVIRFDFHLTTEGWLISEATTATHCGPLCEVTKCSGTS